MGDDPAAEIGRHIALAGLALSQAAYLMDEERGPTEVAELRRRLAQRKVVRLLSDAAQLASLFDIGDEGTAYTAPANGLRVVRGSGDSESAEAVTKKKPSRSEVIHNELTWECSRLSAPHGLEVAELPTGSVALRDADDPAAAVLVASRWEAEAFAASITAGAFVRLR
jgi:hypothetical protein